MGLRYPNNDAKELIQKVQAIGKPIFEKSTHIHSKIMRLQERVLAKKLMRLPKVLG